jgi:NADPH:quinone reductase
MTVMSSLSIGLHRGVSYTERAMRAIVIEAFETEPKLASLPPRELGPNDLRVRIGASSVNGFDLSVIDGTVRTWMEYELPVTLGRDFAGVVEEVGASVSRYRPGDEVFGCFFPMTLKDGTWAEQLVVPEDMFVARKPRSLGPLEAAALPLAGIAALKTVDIVDPREDDLVLVVGATGGVGGYALQLLRAREARVVATSTSEDEPRLLSLGAESTIDFTSTDVVSFVRDQGWKGFRGLIDTVSGAATVAELATLMEDGSRIATTTGAADVDALARSGIVAGNIFATAEPELLERLARHADQGDLKPPIDRVYPLGQALEAVAHFRGGTHGKVGISIAPGGSD